MRLDNYLTEKGYFDSRTKAKQAVERNEVMINGKPINKPSYEINHDKPISVGILTTERFVSLGGYKLQKALNDFKFPVSGMVAADLGSSTGGFTDCLIQNGAEKVYAVDLNDSLLHRRLSANKKVIRLIKNARDLEREDFPCPPDLITADLSFISATYVIPVIENLLFSGKYAIILIKPQFEAGEKHKFKNGIIKDKKFIISACRKIYDCAIGHNLAPQAITEAPRYQNKNSEFLILLKKDGDNVIDLDEYFLNIIF